MGIEGEKAAAEYLLEKGYDIQRCNYRCGKLGEIDIIAGISGITCFIEVKSRSSDKFGVPSESIDKNKMKKIRRLASIYIIENDLNDRPIRFDAVEVAFILKDDKLILKRINVIENAF